MAFDNFKNIAGVQLAYEIRHVRANFIADVPSEPSTTLISDLKFKLASWKGSSSPRAKRLIRFQI